MTRLSRCYHSSKIEFNSCSLPLEIKKLFILTLPRSVCLVIAPRLGAMYTPSSALSLYLSIYLYTKYVWLRKNKKWKKKLCQLIPSINSIWSILFLSWCVGLSLWHQSSEKKPPHIKVTLMHYAIDIFSNNLHLFIYWFYVPRLTVWFDIWWPCRVFG